jgi:hypothetical protein
MRCRYQRNRLVRRRQLRHSVVAQGNRRVSDLANRAGIDRDGDLPEGPTHVSAPGHEQGGAVGAQLRAARVVVTVRIDGVAACQSGAPEPDA